MKRALMAALSLLYPRRAMCMGCGDMTGMREDWVCPACRARMAQLWAGAVPPPEGFDGAAFAYIYTGPPAGIAARMKYGSAHRLADLMAGDMLKAWDAIQPTGVDAITFVPMHPARQRRRGYNHAELLARACAERLGIECLNALERVRNTTQQATLETEARLHNLSGAFAPKAPVEGRRVALVDDICTTGATARGCAEVLRQGGAAAVYLLCYAKAGRRYSSADAGETETPIS